MRGFGAKVGRHCGLGALALAPLAFTACSAILGLGDLGDRPEDAGPNLDALAGDVSAPLDASAESSSGDASADGLLVGLVGWWTFDEGTGSVAHDASGHGNDGKLFGATTWAPGHIGGSVKLGHQGDLVSVADSVTLQFGTKSFSYGLWVMLGSQGNGSSEWEIPFRKGGSNAGTPGYDIEFYQTSPQYGASISDGTNNVVSPFFPPHDYRDGAWHHVFVVVDRALQRATVYVDGVASDSPIDTTTYGSLSGTSALTFGTDSLSTVVGQVDDARVYSRALSSAEVAALAH